MEKFLFFLLLILTIYLIYVLSVFFQIMIRIKEIRGVWSPATTLSVIKNAIHTTISVFKDTFNKKHFLELVSDEIEYDRISNRSKRKLYRAYKFKYIKYLLSGVFFFRKNSFIILSYIK